MALPQKLRNLLLVTVICELGTILVTAQVQFKNGAPQVFLPGGGLLSGTVKLSRDRRPYSSFAGIPYATVPERFQEPQLISKPSLDGVSKAGVVCPQMPLGFASGLDMPSLGDEDCLHLSVCVPQKYNGTEAKPTPVLYPVMMWVHGGGFMASSGSGYDPKYFMDEGVSVIVVRVNYRLGVFGFLSTGDSVVPGNNGLKDMVVALQWIQQNIKSFGGDPSKVTIFGESAGGSAVHYLLLSPVTKGLFHRAISQSGSALGKWTYIPNPKQHAVELATYLKCKTDASEPSRISSEEILACLKGLSTEELNKAQFTFKSSWPMNLRPNFFAPSKEPTDRISNLTPFLPESPISILTRNDSTFAGIPWMVGATEDEGAGMYAGLVLSNPLLLHEINSNWENIAPSTFDFGKYVVSKEEQAQVSQKLKQFYFGDKGISKETRVQLRNLFSDELFLYGVYRSAFETARKGTGNPVYLYQFAYKGPFSVLPKVYQYSGEENELVGHVDDLLYLFDIGEAFPGTKDAIKPGSPDEEFSKHLVRLWTSFAIHGEPKYTWGNATSKKWKSISKKELDGVNSLKWFRIQKEPVSYEINQSVKDRMKFWDDLWREHFAPPILSGQYTKENKNKHNIRGP